MIGWVFATASALWLGVMTSVSPCPLAANIAAMSYVGRDITSRRRTLAAGILYTFGRALSYATIGAILTLGLLSIPQIALALQQHMTRALGPLLILTGLVLFGVIPLPSLGGRLSSGLAERVGGGLIGALPLGAVLALAFCPVSAALFFGGLVPLALEKRSPLWLPAVYGVGTGLPVVAFAILLSVGAGWAGKAFNKVSAVELWARRTTAAVIVVVGLYYTLTATLRGAPTI